MEKQANFKYKWQKNFIAFKYECQKEKEKKP
jgi:hypothetical protein